MFNISVNPTKIGNKFCLWHSRFQRLQRDYGLSALHSTILSTESSIDYFCLDCWSRAAGGLLWNQNPVIIILFTRRHIEPLDGLNKKTNEKKKAWTDKNTGKGDDDLLAMRHRQPWPFATGWRQSLRFSKSVCCCCCWVGTAADLRRNVSAGSPAIPQEPLSFSVSV